MKILILSCDKNKDLWCHMKYFLDKYWKDRPETYILTDKLDCEYFNTIKKDYPISKWSRRVHDAVEEIDDTSILIFPDDLFIYEKVDTDKLNKIVSYIDDNTGSINLHRRFSVKEEYVNDLIQKRPKHAKYTCSVMCSVWNKKNMLDVFDCDLDPWQFEKTVNDKNYDYYVYNSIADLFKFREPDNHLFGLWRSEWTKHCVNLFNKEGISQDFNERGIFNG